MTRIPFPLFWYLLVVLTVIIPASSVEAAAQSAVVIDVQTRRILYQRNADEPMYPASTTKIVTSLVVMENAQPAEKIRIQPASVGIEGSSVWLEAGEELTVEDLLYAVLLESGNDAAHALATYVAGDVQRFAQLMTDRARHAGATHTVMKNPHGLPNDEHVISALDMALVTADFLEYPLLKTIAGTEVHSIPWANHDWQRRLYNHNRYLGIDDIDGVKTGYTRAAQHTFVASATRDGHQLVAVVLRTTRNGKFEESSSLMDDAFSSYKWEVPNISGAPGSVTVARGIEEVVPLAVSLTPVPVLNDGSERLSVDVQTVDTIEAPVQAGQQLGEALVRVNGQVVYRSPFTAKKDVARKYTWWEKLMNGVKRLTDG